MGFNPCTFLCVCSLITLVLGCLLYFPIQYSIYSPYFDQEWKSAKCMVNSIKQFQFPSPKNRNSHTSYSLFDVKISINGQWLQGFACGSSVATFPSAINALNGAYPYQYSLCSSDNVCGNMLMMPSWYCNDCESCGEFLTQEEKDCKYFLKNANSEIDNAIEIPVGYMLDYPTEHSTFIQVIFMDSPFYFESDYLALQIICFWIMIIAPSVYIVLYIIFWSIIYILNNC